MKTSILRIFLAILLVFFNFNAVANDEVVWVDVRSIIEHKIDHIDGDARISHADIVEEVSALHPEKETSIALYCRSGGRAGKALIALKEAGYENVRNVGSIEQARKERGIKD